mmetsp:Transcript_41560/g.123378  ORF Transcript_41560/g.123378 Transcript_41560/m.123378 type:complete len:264 (-) Transcript_41560:128-919(-)
MASSVVSVSWPRASVATSTPIFMIMSETPSAATGSRSGKPRRAPQTPTRATTDDHTSLRWCLALARMTGELRRRPTMSVARKSTSFERMDARQARSAARPGMLHVESIMQTPQLICRSSFRASTPMPMPAAKTQALTPSAPTASKRPCPYGWSSSGGSRAILTAHSVTPSLTRSETEWPASATRAVEHDMMPTTSFTMVRATLTPTPAYVTFIAASSSSDVPSTFCGLWRARFSMIFRHDRRRPARTDRRNPSKSPAEAAWAA